MSKLSSEKCEACQADAPRLDDAGIAELSVQVPDWSVVDVDGVKRLVRRFKFKDFVEALAFTNAVGELAESQDHHPAILTEWGQVEVSWWSHKIKGLHRNDFIMAARTDTIVTK